MSAIVLGFALCGWALATYLWMTRPNIARLREIIREEMDAETVWLSGPHTGDTNVRREHMAKDRDNAILRGQREGF